MRGRAGDIEMRQRLARLDQAQEGEAAIEHADIAVGRDHGDGMAGQRDAADQIAFRAPAARAAASAPPPAARMPACRSPPRHPSPRPPSPFCPASRSGPGSVRRGPHPASAMRLPKQSPSPAAGIAPARRPPWADSAARGHSHPRPAPERPAATASAAIKKRMIIRPAAARCGKPRQSPGAAAWADNCRHKASAA